MWVSLLIILILMAVLQQVFYNYIFCVKENFNNISLDAIDNRNESIKLFLDESDNMINELESLVNSSSYFVDLKKNIEISNIINNNLTKYNELSENIKIVKNDIIKLLIEIKEELREKLTQDRMKKLYEMKLLQIREKLKYYFELIEECKKIIKEVKENTENLNDSIGGENSDLRFYQPYINI